MSGRLRRRGPAACALRCLAQGPLVVLLATLGCSQAPPPRPGPSWAPAQERPSLAQADRFRRRGELEAALSRYREARERSPQRVPVHLRTVATLRALGRRAEAAAEYRARAERPGALAVDRVLAQVLASDGASSTLRRLYGEAMAGDPAEPWWLLARAEVELAEADAWNQQRLSAIDSGDRAAETKAYAQARGALYRAEPDVARAHRLAPTLAEPDLYLGHLRALEGDLAAGAAARSAAYRAGADAFERAVALDADLVEAWAGLADVRGRLGLTDEALEAWAEAGRRAPADADLRLALAGLLDQAGRGPEALTQYRAVAVLRPREAEPWLRMGDVLAGEERFEPALEAYAEALRRDPDALEAHARAGAILEHRGRLAEARAAYQRYVDQGGERREEIQKSLERLVHADARR